MLNQLRKRFISWNRLEVPALGLLLTISFATSAIAVEKPQKQQTKAEASKSVLLAATPRSTTSIPDGIYLYGQSPQPEQIGKEYLVLEVRSGKAVGAFYLPSSEFSCVYGTVGSRQLSLNVVDPYEQTTHKYAIALDRKTQVATASNRLPKPEIGLQGFHQIDTVSANDKRILNTCKSSR